MPRSLARIAWILPHPTPYNIYLLNGLNDRLQTPSEAIYRWEVMKSHPWANLPERRFDWRAVDPPGGRDPTLDERCKGEQNTLFVFVGWRDATMRSALLLRYLKRLPYALWADTPKVGGSIPRRAVNRAYVVAARRALSVLATGSPAVERFVAMGLPLERVDSFPFVVDPEHFALAPDLRARRDGDGLIRFVMCGRLIDDVKGQSVALRAFARACACLPAKSLELVVAGVGPSEDYLRQLATELGIAERVRFPGWVQYDELPQLLGNSDALVLPSLWDPFPVAVMEAMAAGLPVLASRACGSARERVVDGVNGFIHDPGDAAGLFDHMVRLGREPELRLRMGEDALHTSRRWGIDQAAAVLERVLARMESF